MRRLSYLALSMALMAAPALAVPTSPSDHGLFDGGAYPPQASGLVTYVDLGNELASYVTQVSLTSTLSAYLTTSAAASTYLPLSGGVLTGNLRSGNGASFQICSSNGDCADLYNGGGRTLVWDGFGSINVAYLSGTGNAYACLNASGTIYRSATACQ